MVMAQGHLGVHNWLTTVNPYGLPEPGAMFGLMVLGALALLLLYLGR